jgi:signal transduction histidine kinase
MISGLPIWPVWAVDLFGSSVMIIFAFLSLRYAFKISRKDPENLIWSYLVVLALVFSAFSIGRGAGHIAKIVLISMGKQSAWEKIAPISGAINTATFMFIASITFYYHKVEKTFYVVQNYAKKITEAYDKLEKAYQEIKEDQEKIIRLERRATAARMASLLAHETRNPILSIGGFVKILQRKFACDFELGPKLEIILAETEKLEQLVAGILKAGHEMATELQETNPDLIFEALLESVQGKARLAQVRVLTEKEPVKAQLIVDKDSIVMALKEVFVNAIEASPQHGEVSLRMFQEGDNVVFTIQDHGQGIAAEIQNKIFEPLFSTKKLASGLGLSYAKEMIETHEGRITFETKEGDGTTFFISLPLSGVSP